MARGLTKKQRGYVNDVADGVPGVKAVLNHYDTTDYSTAGNIASENLEKPKIINALKALGFDSNNAKRVIGERLNDTHEETSNRLRAAEMILKVNGEYAAEKVIYLNIEAKPTEALKELAHGLLNRQRE